MNMKLKNAPRIREMIVTPIAITDPPLLNAAGLHAPYALRTIVELITDDNISGVSEIPGNISINESLELARHLIIGKSPIQLNSIGRELENYFGKETASVT
jgi:glucarate dehydratase